MHLSQMGCNLKKAGHRVKRAEIWESSSLVTDIGCMGFCVQEFSIVSKLARDSNTVNLRETLPEIRDSGNPE